MHERATIAFLTRPGCGLCDRARTDLQLLLEERAKAGRVPARVREVDIATDAALDHVSGAERASDLAHVRAFAAERKGGVAGDYHQVPEARELGDDILGDAIAEVDLLGIATHVLERQHRHGWLVGQAHTGHVWRGNAVKHHPVSAHGPRDVLEAQLARMLEADIELAL